MTRRAPHIQRIARHRSQAVTSNREPSNVFVARTFANRDSVPHAPPPPHSTASLDRYAHTNSATAIAQPSTPETRTTATPARGHHSRVPPPAPSPDSTRARPPPPSCPPTRTLSHHQARSRAPSPTVAHTHPHSRSHASTPRKRTNSPPPRSWPARWHRPIPLLLAPTHRFTPR